MKAAPSNTLRRTRSTALILGIAALIVAGLSITTAPAHADSPYVVNSSGDQSDPSPGDGNCGAFGQCTLRSAIQEANASVGADVINFNIPNGQATIRPDTPLPTITGQTTIDGYTQSGSSPNTLAAGDNAVITVRLLGDVAGTSADGLDITGSNVTVKGLQIIDFDGSGVQIRNQGSTAALGVNVAGNFIGTDGVNNIGNGGDGIEVFGSNTGRHVIGGDAPSDRNIISGNERSGVELDGAPNNTVQNNYIGTDRDGTNEFTNDDLGNDVHGLELDSSGGNIIKDNIISENDFNGVFIDGPDASDNKVLGNRIGTDRTGKKNLGNGESGVSIIRGMSNIVGDGTVSGSNTIAFSDRSGIEISGEAENTKLNTVSRNSIFSNGSTNFNAKGISLSNSNLPFPNDPKDADTGANGFQNYPVLSSARTSKTGTSISGKLNSSPNATFSVEFFTNPKGTDEGKTYLGKKTISTDANGNASFSFKTKTRLAAELNVTTTATRLFLGPTDTSEFSLPKKVVADLKPPKVVSVSPADGASSVSATANIIATFNEAMQPSTINLKTVKLRKVSSTASVLAKVTYDKTKKRAILNPNASLKAGTYIAVVSTGVRDLAGNALDQDPKAKGNQAKTWKFTVKK